MIHTSSPRASAAVLSANHLELVVRTVSEAQGALLQSVAEVQNTPVAKHR